MLHSGNEIYCLLVAAVLGIAVGLGVIARKGGQMTFWDGTAPVIQEIVIERDRQNARWGVQNHPDGTGHEAYGITLASAREVCDDAARAGTVTWDLILMEEVYEAVAEEDPVRLRAELIQVAAVAVAWVEAIDRRGVGAPPA